MGERMDDLVLTYSELGERLGLAPEGARAKAKRKAKAGEWAIIVGNDGRARVRLPAGALPEHPPDRTPDRTREHQDNARPDAQEAVDRLSAELARALGEAREARTRLEELGAEVVEVRVALARVEAERDGARDLVARLERQLEDARRPWWRRWVG